MRFELGMVVRYQGKLAEVVSIANGRTVGLQFVGEEPCPFCKRSSGVELLEHAPLLQDHVEPVETVAS